MDWVGWVLVSACLHAIWNGIIKETSDTAAASTTVVLIAALVSSIGAVVEGPPASGMWVGIVSCGLVEAAYFITLSAALSAAPLKVAYPLVRGAGQLLAWPVAIWGLGELVSPEEIIGGGLLAMGLALGAAGVPRGRGLGWILACAVTIGVYPSVYKWSLNQGISPFGLFAGSMWVALPVLMAGLGRHWRSRIRAVFGFRTLLAGGLCAVSFICFLFALDLGGAALASALRNVSVFVAVLIGISRGEGASTATWASVVLIVIGAGLLVV